MRFAYNNNTPVEEVLTANTKVSKLLGIDDQDKPIFLSINAILNWVPNIENRIIGLIDNTDISNSTATTNKAPSRRATKKYVDDTKAALIGTNGDNWSTAKTLWGLKDYVDYAAEQVEINVVGRESDIWGDEYTLYALKQYVDTEAINNLIGDANDNAFEQDKTLYSLNRRLVEVVQKAIYGSYSYDPSHPTRVDTLSWSDKTFAPSGTNILSTKMGSNAHIFDCKSENRSMCGNDSHIRYHLNNIPDLISGINNGTVQVKFAPAYGSTDYVDVSGMTHTLNALVSSTGYMLTLSFTCIAFDDSNIAAQVSLLLLVTSSGSISSSDYEVPNILFSGNGTPKLKVLEAHFDNGFDLSEVAYSKAIGSYSDSWSDSYPTIWGLKNYVDSNTTNVVGRDGDDWDATDPTIFGLKSFCEGRYIAYPDVFLSETELQLYSGLSGNSPALIAASQRSGDNIHNLASLMYYDGLKNYFLDSDSSFSLVATSLGRCPVFNNFTGIFKVKVLLSNGSYGWIKFYAKVSNRSNSCISISGQQDWDAIMPLKFLWVYAVQLPASQITPSQVSPNPPAERSGGDSRSPSKHDELTPEDDSEAV